MSRWASLAARNLRRHGRRTLLTGAIVVVGFVAVTMTAGFVSQTFRSLRSATIRSVGGHLRILDPRAAGKTDDEASTILLDDWPGLAALLSRDPHVVQAMPKLSFFGLVVKGDRSAAYLGTGTIPALEKQASLAADSVQSGRFLSDPDANEVMLGGGLARAVGARVGDLVTVMTTTPDGGLNAVDATVTAVLGYPIKELDDRVLFMPYGAAARLLKAEGRANSVVVLLRDDHDAERVARELSKSLAAAGRPVVVKTWLDTAAFYKQVKLLYTAIFFFMGLVLAVVVVLATANTMTMSVFERTREIGTLLAIGMERSDVRTLFLLEGVLLGLAGSGIGAVLSLLLRAALNASGIMLPPPPGATRGNVLHVDFIPLAYGIGFAVMSATLLVAAWWPARRASRLNPVEALAHV
ncbi:MAG TPA: FtsX-like permease family protein [Thermoanaerobaculia bacterium]|nr:FtsX-like permease family protein [Thermoanaerobaculia bacterium]